MKAVILARVSTEEQREAGNSLPAQVQRLTDYCKRKGFQIAETYSFDESAYKTKRDEFDKILDYLNSHKEKVALCFDKVDRLSRNVFDKRVAVLCEKAVANEIELHFISDGQVVDASMSAAEKFQFSMSLGLAKYYSDAISDNVKRAFEQKRRVGEWTGNAPLGYKNIPLDVEHRTRKDIVLDPERAHLIRNMFELYATGQHSLETLRQRITDLGLRTRSGKKLARSNVDYVLRDPFYYGLARSWKYGTYPHRYDHIITRELFEQCQKVMQERSNKSSKMASNPMYIFRGLITCKNCGCLITAEQKKGKYTYYSCTNGKGNCHRTYVPEKELLKPVYGIFERFKAIPVAAQERLVQELKKVSDHETVFHAREVGRIQAEYSRVQGRITALLDMRLDQSITQDDYDKKLQELKDEQYRLNIELEEYTKADHHYHIHVSAVLNLSRHVGEIFESSEPTEKRAILGFLLQNSTLSDRTLEFTLRKPFEAVFELVNCHNWRGLLNKFRTADWQRMLDEIQLVGLVHLFTPAFKPSPAFI